MTRISASPDGAWLVTGNWRGDSITVWSLGTGEPELEIPAVNADAVFSPDGKWLVVCLGKEFQIREAGSWRITHQLHRPPDWVAGRACFSADGSLLVLAHTSSVLRLVDPATGEQMATLEPPELRGVASLCFTPDGSELVVATPDSRLQVWDLRRIRQELAAIGLDWNLAPYRPPSAPRHEPLRIEVCSDAARD